MSYRKNAEQNGRKKSGDSRDPLGPNSEIGRKLKQYYDELVSEEIPDRFDELLRQLEGKEKQSQAPAKED